MNSSARLLISAQKENRSSRETAPAGCAWLPHKCETEQTCALVHEAPTLQRAGDYQGHFESSLVDGLMCAFCSQVREPGRCKRLRSSLPPDRLCRSYRVRKNRSTRSATALKPLGFRVPDTTTVIGTSLVGVARYATGGYTLSHPFHEF